MVGKWGVLLFSCYLLGVLASYSNDGIISEQLLYVVYQLGKQFLALRTLQSRCTCKNIYLLVC